MPAHHDGGPSKLSRALRETLDSIVAPAIRDALIHDALILAGLRQLPEDPASVRSFASGPLRRAAERALGFELARSLADEIVLTIQPALDSRPPAARDTSRPPAFSRTDPAGPPQDSTPPTLTANSIPPPPTPRISLPAPATPRVPVPEGDRDPWPSGNGSHIRSNGERRASEPPPPGMVPATSISGNRPAIDAPFVLVSTEDSALFQTLAEWFSSRARVCRVRSPIDLVRHMDGAQGQRCIVIADGKYPGVTPAQLIVLLETEPHVEVVLCRAAPATEQVVLSSPETTGRWLVYREPASLDHVAAECLRLVS